MGYLVSFGDTMTALLAFFIVLNSLADEQTGANLHAGTGSFVQALKSFGVPGIFPSQLSSQAFQLNETAPKYVVPSEEADDAHGKGTGPDDTAEQDRIIDHEHEEFQRFLHELDRWHDVTSKPAVDGEVVFDLFAALGPEGSVAPKELFSAARQASPVLRRDGYEAEIIVWATTPSTTAWTRAIQQADALRDELANYLQLTQAEHRLTATGRTWNSSDARRPTVSLVVRRLK